MDSASASWLQGSGFWLTGLLSVLIGALVGAIVALVVLLWRRGERGPLELARDAAAIAERSARIAQDALGEAARIKQIDVVYREFRQVQDDVAEVIAWSNLISTDVLPNQAERLALVHATARLRSSILATSNQPAVMQQVQALADAVASHNYEAFRTQLDLDWFNRLQRAVLQLRRDFGLDEPPEA